MADTFAHSIRARAQQRARGTGRVADPAFAWLVRLLALGALPFLYGTLATATLALLLGGPVALGTAIFLAELAPPWLREPASTLVELLAAVPSVVYGLWGIFVLAPLLRSTVEPFLRRTLGFIPLFSGPAYGVGMLAGGL